MASEGYAASLSPEETWILRKMLSGERSGKMSSMDISIESKAARGVTAPPPGSYCAPPLQQAMESPAGSKAIIDAFKPDVVQMSARARHRKSARANPSVAAMRASCQLDTDSGQSNAGKDGHLQLHSSHDISRLRERQNGSKNTDQILLEVGPVQISKILDVSQGTDVALVSSTGTVAVTDKKSALKRTGALHPAGGAGLLGQQRRAATNDEGEPGNPDCASAPADDVKHAKEEAISPLGTKPSDHGDFAPGRTVDPSESSPLRTTASGTTAKPCSPAAFGTPERDKNIIGLVGSWSPMGALLAARSAEAPTSRGQSARLAARQEVLEGQLQLHQHKSKGSTGTGTAPIVRSSAQTASTEGRRSRVCREARASSFGFADTPASTPAGSMVGSWDQPAVGPRSIGGASSQTPGQCQSQHNGGYDDGGNRSVDSADLHSHLLGTAGRSTKAGSGAQLPLPVAVGAYEQHGKGYTRSGVSSPPQGAGTGVAVQSVTSAGVSGDRSLGQIQAGAVAAVWDVNGESSENSTEAPALSDEMASSSFFPPLPFGQEMERHSRSSSGSVSGLIQAHQLHHQRQLAQQPVGIGQVLGLDLNVQTRFQATNRKSRSNSVEMGPFGSGGAVGGGTGTSDWDSASTPDARGGPRHRRPRRLSLGATQIQPASKPSGSGDGACDGTLRVPAKSGSSEPTGAGADAQTKANSAPSTRHVYHPELSVPQADAVGPLPDSRAGTETPSAASDEWASVLSDTASGRGGRRARSETASGGTLSGQAASATESAVSAASAQSHSKMSCMHAKGVSGTASGTGSSSSNGADSQLLALSRVMSSRSIPMPVIRSSSNQTVPQQTITHPHGSNDSPVTQYDHSCVSPLRASRWGRQREASPDSPRSIPITVSWLGVWPIPEDIVLHCRDVTTGDSLKMHDQSGGRACRKGHGYEVEADALADEEGDDAAPATSSDVAMALYDAFDAAGLRFRNPMNVWRSIQELQRRGDYSQELFDEIIVLVVRTIKETVFQGFCQSPFFDLWMRIDESVKRWKVPDVDSYDWLGQVGKGGYATVYAARCKQTGNVYAMKKIDKRLIKKRKQEKSVQIEKGVMTSLKCPFIAELHCAFQDRTHVVLGMPMIAGGDIEAYLTRKGPFPEAVSRFLLAEIVLGLKYLHERGIMHRDIKPANVLVTHDGHAVLSDMGLATYVWNASLDGLLDEIREDQGGMREGVEVTYGDFAVRRSVHGSLYLNGNRIKPHARGKAGTPGFWAPEMLLRDRDGRPGRYTGTADWWSFGCLAYAMLVGVGPFTVLGGNTDDDNRATLTGSVHLPHGRISKQGRSLIAQLLVRDPQRRLGNRGSWEIMSHPFFEGVEWALLEQKCVPPPWRPPIGVIRPKADDPSPRELAARQELEAIPLTAADQQHYVGFEYVDRRAVLHDMVSGLRVEAMDRALQAAKASRAVQARAASAEPEALHKAISDMQSKEVQQVATRGTSADIGHSMGHRDVVKSAGAMNEPSGVVAGTSKCGGRLQLAVCGNEAPIIAALSDVTDRSGQATVGINPMDLDEVRNLVASLGIASASSRTITMDALGSEPGGSGATDAPSGTRARASILAPFTEDTSHMKAWLGMNTVIRGPSSKDKEARAEWTAKRQGIIEAANALKQELSERRAALKGIRRGMSSFGGTLPAWCLRRLASAVNGIGRTEAVPASGSGRFLASGAAVEQQGLVPGTVWLQLDDPTASSAQLSAEKPSSWTSTDPDADGNVFSVLVRHCGIVPELPLDSSSATTTSSATEAAAGGLSSASSTPSAPEGPVAETVAAGAGDVSAQDGIKRNVPQSEDTEDARQHGIPWAMMVSQWSVAIQQPDATASGTAAGRAPSSKPRIRQPVHGNPGDIRVGHGHGASRPLQRGSTADSTPSITELELLAEMQSLTPSSIRGSTSRDRVKGVGMGMGIGARPNAWGDSVEDDDDGNGDGLETGVQQQSHKGYHGRCVSADDLYLQKSQATLARSGPASDKAKSIATTASSTGGLSTWQSSGSDPTKGGLPSLHSSHVTTRSHSGTVAKQSGPTGKHARRRSVGSITVTAEARRAAAAASNPGGLGR